MKTFITQTPSSNIIIGGKAKNLFALQQLNVSVPAWGIIPANIVLNAIPKNASHNDAEKIIHELVLPSSTFSEIAEFFGENHQSKTYAVRSSSIDEDGANHSFAGQFETYLHVSFDELEGTIKKIWSSAISERVQQYRSEHNLSVQYGIGVIVQEMISPNVSGVAFGAHPVNGDSDTRVVSSVYGLGEGLVSGELDADTFEISPKGISKELVSKRFKFVRSSNGKGIEKTDVPYPIQEIESLTDRQLRSIEGLLNTLQQSFGSPQDIEFAIENDTLYLLQTRPITAIGHSKKGEYTLWDNSNIIESYPGVTTPLTFSFISKMYEMVYRQFVELMGVKPSEIDQHKTVFANTLGLVRGRVYYNLLSWYKMLAMLPGYSINAEYMENMMGVKERFELEEDFRMNKGLARIRIIGMIFKMLRLQRRLPNERKRFLDQLESIMTTYKSLDYENMSPSEIIDHYSHFETTVLLKWKAPLINDFFAMIWFGILQKKTSKLFPDLPNLHNDLLCGSQDIISVEPIHQSMKIAQMILDNATSEQLFTQNEPNEIWSQLEQGVFPTIKIAIDQYIDRFGERCVGELKLETVSYRQNPTAFIRILQSYVQQNITQSVNHNSLEDQLRIEAERHVANKLKRSPLKRWWFNYILQKARDLVSNRENLRYERTRGFGMVRTMFNALGNRLHMEGILQNPRDIFYLELNEILSLRSQPFPKDFNDLIDKRKQEFDNYKKQDDPEERFFTYGHHFSDEFIYSREKLEPIEGDLKGTGCCPGHVEGTVRVVKDPSEITTLNGDILVTSSTDPGWVTLFPTASAIIVERGSLLSHSAIVSREMGIPCIVSVSGLLRTLKTGDQVRMDGSTGEIQLLKQ